MKTPNDENAGLLPLQFVAVGKIRPDPRNRKDHDEAKLKSLAESIAREGLLQPVVLRIAPDSASGTDYVIVAGERRWLAHKLNKTATIQARVLPKIGDSEADQKAADKSDVALRGIENLQRENLTDLEEAAVFLEMSLAGYTQVEIGKMAGGRSQSDVANTMALLKLPEKVRGFIADGKLTAAHGKALVKFAKWPAACEVIAQVAINEEQTSKDLEGFMNYHAEQQLREKKLAVRIHQHAFPGNKIPNELLDSGSLVKAGHETWCFDLAAYDRVMAPILAAEMAEQAAARQRSANARETDKGWVIEQKSDEYLVALLPADEIGKRGGKTVALNSKRWTSILGARNDIVRGLNENVIRAAATDALELLKKAKTISPAMAAVLFSDGHSEFDLCFTPKQAAEPWVKTLGVSFKGSTYADLAKLDLVSQLKIAIGARLRNIAGGHCYIDPDDLAPMLCTVLGRPSLGFLEETAAGRAQLLEKIAKTLKIPQLLLNPQVNPNAKAAKTAKPAKKGGRK